MHRSLRGASSPSPSLRRTSLRRAARVTALTLPLVLALVVPATAYAGTPVTWEDPPPMSRLTALLLFGGVPLGLFVLIAFLTVAPSLARGGDRGRGVDRWANPEWFNGPLADDQSLDHSLDHSLDGEVRPALPAGGGASAALPDGAHAARTEVSTVALPGGGASARW